jgi:hypothetical protein
VSRHPVEPLEVTMHPQLTLELVHDAQQRRLEDARRSRGPGRARSLAAPTVQRLSRSHRVGVLALVRRIAARLSPVRRPA